MSATTFAPQALVASPARTPDLGAALSALSAFARESATLATANAPHCYGINCRICTR